MSPSPTPRSPLFALAAVLLALFAPGPAFAQALNWVLPAGGETWTAGTTHTVQWAGGAPGWSVNVRVIRMSPFQVADIVATGTPNDGFASWTIPAGIGSGSYQLYVEEASAAAWSYSQTITIQTLPPCRVGCTQVAVAMAAYEPPAGACGATPGDAAAAAQAYSQQQLAGACPVDYAIDPSSVITDVTLLPAGVCLPGYGGAYVAEASSVACCCPAATPAGATSWGRVKSTYR